MTFAARFIWPPLFRRQCVWRGLPVFIVFPWLVVQTLLTGFGTLNSRGFGVTGDAVDPGAVYLVTVMLGHLAVNGTERKAQTAETRAEFRRLLRLFADLVVRDQMPPPLE